MAFVTPKCSCGVNLSVQGGQVVLHVDTTDPVHILMFRSLLLKIPATETEGAIEIHLSNTFDGLHEPGNAYIGDVLFMVASVTVHLTTVERIPDRRPLLVHAFLALAERILDGESTSSTVSFDDRLQLVLDKYAALMSGLLQSSLYAGWKTNTNTQVDKYVKAMCDAVRMVTGGTSEPLGDVYEGVTKTSSV
jgi:hypothetical protein